MTLEILFRYLHFLSILVMFSSVVSEHLLLKPRMTRSEIQRLSVLDAVYGISALIIVGIGLTLWFGVGKPAEFYTKNWIFHLKVGLFIIVAILSIYPTVFFLRNRKGNNPAELVDVPKSIVWLIRLELLLLAFIPLCAALMAKGIGYFG
jgi:putative membrane protein